MLCPVELGKAFFEEKGLAQHFGVKHPEVKFEEKLEQQAWRLFRVKHGEETRRHVEWLLTLCVAEGGSCCCYCNLHFTSC